MERDEDLDDEGWDVRETFAYFGRAFYMASVLEVGLAHALMWGEFLMQQAAKVKVNGKDFDKRQYEADFDSYMEKQFRQTMGSVVRSATTLPYFTAELKHRIEVARRRRNYLTHDYWREAAVRFMTPEGRQSMRQELDADAESFGKLDQDIDEALKSAREAVGARDDILKRHCERMLAQIKAGTLKE